MTNDVPSGSGFVDLLEAFRESGGTAPGDIVGRLLADHHVGTAASLAKLVQSGKLFGFEWRRNFWLPMFQFNACDLSIATAPRAVRAELPTLWSGWAVAMWFAMPNMRLEGHRPVDCLANDSAAVLQAARALPPAEDNTFMHVQAPRELAAHA